MVSLEFKNIAPIGRDMWKNFVGAFFGAFLFCGSASAAVYYVSPNGNDLASGAQASPWKTLLKASGTVVAGDTVRVLPGTYNERVAESTSGTASNYITYISDTPHAATVRGFRISGSYVRVIGFEITHLTNVGYEAVRVEGSTTGVQVLDNFIHHVSASGGGSGVTLGGARSLVIRGNIITWTGSPGGDNLGSGAKAIGNIGDSAPVLIEYNDISHTTDFLTPEGGLHIYRNNVLGPTGSTDFGGSPHVDGYQPNEGTTNCFMEANWHVDNPMTDSHLYLDEIENNHHIAMVKNVSIRSGDTLGTQWRVADYHFAAHNTIGQIGFGPRGGPANGGVFYIWDNSINNVSRNNIFTNATSGSILYAVQSGGQITTDHDLSWPLGSAAIKADPRFVNYGGYDFRIRADSPAVNAAGALTTVSSSGSGTTVTVEEPHWFHDGFGVTEGHKIYVGNNNNLTVVAVNYGNRTLTVSSPITFSAGDSVGYAYLGSGPDLGAYEEGATILTAATLVSSGTQYSVTTTGDARFVIFYVDGIPAVTDFSAPFSANLAAGTVTAKAFALHPQAKPVVNATAGGTGENPPSAPENLRVVQ
jgi:hypothetical protein